MYVFFFFCPVQPITGNLVTQLNLKKNQQQQSDKDMRIMNLEPIWPQNVQNKSPAQNIIVKTPIPLKSE